MATREELRQAIQKAGVELHSGNLDRISICRLLDEVKPLETSERQLVLAEAATLMCTYFLRAMGPLYDGFADTLWLLLSRAENIESLVDNFKSPTKKTAYATGQYHDYMRGMFSRSSKTRHEFYYDMLIEAGIVVDYDSINFGANAAAFKRKAEMTIHMEHLLVFYSVELFLKAHMDIYPKDSPIAGEKLDIFYRHFEAAIPLAEKFDRYAKDDGLFLSSASRRRLPLIN